MEMYFDRQGRPMSREKWLASFADCNLREVAETILPDGKRISTVWLGLDHQFDDGPPLIFETAVFPNKEDFSDLDMDRYSTEAEALAGHERMVKKWSRK